MTSLLKIEGLHTSFHTEDGTVRAVRGVDLNLQPAETLALVGESGCGKSVTALSVMRLIPQPPGYFESGKISFRGRDLLSISENEMNQIRGNDIGMIFQEPMTSLNPIFTIGDQISEGIELHQNKSKREALQLALEALRKVAIPAPEQRLNQYPHELSGGMKQRIMIAMAISCRPALLIADEPTTALDSTIQAQILDLLESIQAENHMSILLITHNLSIVSEYADRVSVMYSGKIVEESSVEKLFEAPAHPYTQGLLSSIPTGEPGCHIEPIPGTVPNPINLPSGCAFHPRCSQAMPHCREKTPPLMDLPDFDSGRRAACWLHEKKDTPQNIS